jgi:hypothetical protein
MSEQADRVDFYGVLGRVALKNGAANLRFYPFAFSTTPDVKCVFVAKFEGVSFQEREVAPLLGEEVEVTVFADRAEVFGVFQGTATILRANSVAVDWSPYDTEDFVRRVGELDAAYKNLNAALTKAVQKNRKALELTRELLRRAEVKADASEDLKARQTAAIAVLERLLRQLESDE